MNTPPRVGVLDDAKKLTLGDRQDTYGSFYFNMKNFAKLINARFGTFFTPHDAATIMSLAKESRKMSNPNVLHRDNYVDDVNYTAAQFECAELQKKEYPDKPISWCTLVSEDNRFETDI